MVKYYCPSNCEHGNIVKCDADDKFSDNTVFTNEEKYPTCPRFKKTEEKEGKENK